MKNFNIKANNPKIIQTTFQTENGNEMKDFSYNFSSNNISRDYINKNFNQEANMTKQSSIIINEK